MIKRNSNSISPNFEQQMISMVSANPLDNSRNLNRLIEHFYHASRHLLGMIRFRFKLDEMVMEDTYQDALLILIERIRGGQFFYQSKAQLYGWLKQTLWNLASNKRSDRVLTCLDGDSEDDALNPLLKEFSDEQPDVDFTMIAPQCSLEEKLRYYIERDLPKQGRNVVIKSFLEGKSNEQVAKEMGYRNEGIARRKKSENLKKFHESISAREGEALLSMAS